MTLNEEANYTRRLDDYLMQRLAKLEATIDEMREHYSEIAVKLDKLAEANEHNKPFIEIIHSILSASGILKWTFSTAVVIAAGCAAVVTAVEFFQKWLEK